MDNPCGLSSESLYAALKKYGDLTAHELAALLKVSIRQVLCAIHHEGFAIEAVAWEGTSWKYRPRAIVNKRLAKTADVPKEYAGRTVKPGSYT
jgi:hypothetical protein